MRWGCQFGHGRTERIEGDARRTEALNARGYRVIRFWNDEVLHNSEEVLQIVAANLGKPPPHPDPLRPEGRRGNLERRRQ